MARQVESEKCDAVVAMGPVIAGTAQAGATLPCSRWLDGKCLRDSWIEEGLPKVKLIRGSCKADLEEGKQEEIRKGEPIIGESLVSDQSPETDFLMVIRSNPS